MPDLHSLPPMSQADHLYRELGEAKRQLAEAKVKADLYDQLMEATFAIAEQSDQPRPEIEALLQRITELKETRRQLAALRAAGRDFLAELDRLPKIGAALSTWTSVARLRKEIDP